MESTLLVGGFAALVLEGIKWVYRKVAGTPEMDFPKAFYLISLPILAFVSEPFLAWLGFASFTVPTDWMTWAFELARVAVQTVVAVAVYELGVKPLKEYQAEE
jgi:hypothetical protein